MKLICDWRFNYREKWGEIDTEIDYSVGMILAAENFRKYDNTFKRTYQRPSSYEKSVAGIRYLFAYICSASACSVMHMLRLIVAIGFEIQMQCVWPRNVQGRINRLVHCRLACSWRFMASKILQEEGEQSLAHWHDYPQTPFHWNIYVVRRNTANGIFAGARMKWTQSARHRSVVPTAVRS